MNKVITINLGGTAWQLEEGGYDTLRAYLETATARLQGNPDREEIISDIEWAIAEKFRALVNNHKNVVLNKEVTAVLAEMGPIEVDPGKTLETGPSAAGAAGGPSAAGSTKEERAPGASGTPHRLYRIHEGSMIAGVCNGVAAYLNIDPTIVRLAFVFMVLAWGVGVLAYVIMAIVVPEAHTPEEKAAASGNRRTCWGGSSGRPFTAQEFIRRAHEGYYEAMKGFPNRQARREWKRRFKRDMRAHADEWRHNWHSYWTQQAPLHPGMAFTLPFLSLLHGIASILWVCALVSLLATGSVFGLALPANVPVWVAALLLFIVYGVIAGPLKLARRACSWGFGQPRPAWSFFFLADAVVWLAVVGVLVWLGSHYFPELNQAVKSLPVLVHQAINDIQTWWKGK